GHRFLERGHLRVEVGDLRGRSNQLLLNRLLARAQVVGIDRLRDAAGHDNKYEYQPANMRLPPWPPVIAPVVGGGHHSRSAGLPAKTRTPPTVPPLARRRPGAALCPTPGRSLRGAPRRLLPPRSPSWATNGPPPRRPEGLPAPVLR